MNILFKKSIVLIFLFMLMSANAFAIDNPFANTAFNGADFSDNYDTLKSKKEGLLSSYNTETDSDKKLIIQLQISMSNSQMEVITSYDNMKTRITSLLKNDTRKDSAEESLTTAGTNVGTFINLDVAKKNTSNNSGFEFIEQGTYAYQASPKKFTAIQKKAIQSINSVNKTLLNPSKPSGVPSGDLITDFVPGVIRILFRFASFASLISLIISGLMFTAAFGNEERVTKARSMIYYSLIGFACVVLAFAVIKAITDIDFFGFI